MITDRCKLRWFGRNDWLFLTKFWLNSARRKICDGDYDSAMHSFLIAVDYFDVFEKHFDQNCGGYIP